MSSGFDNGIDVAGLVHCIIPEIFEANVHGNVTIDCDYCDIPLLVHNIINGNYCCFRCISFAAKFARQAQKFVND